MSKQAPAELPQGIDYKETGDVFGLHAAARSQRRNPATGVAPLSIWLAAVWILAVFWSGFYFGRYSGEFSGESLDPGGAKNFSGPPVTAKNEMELNHGPGAAATVTIMIRNMKFEPATLEVRQGDVIEWKNDDLTPHTATTAQFDSGSIEPEKSWRYTVRKSGTFPYACTFHPDMKGTVVVK
jgi:plastocyanin